MAQNRLFIFFFFTLFIIYTFISVFTEKNRNIFLVGRSIKGAICNKF